GWEPQSRFAFASKKPPAGPFAAEGTDNPAVVTPLRQLTAPTIVLSFGTPVPARVPVDPPATPANSAAPATSGTSAPAASGTSAPSAPAASGSAPSAPAGSGT